MNTQYLTVKIVIGKKAVCHMIRTWFDGMIMLYESEYWTVNNKTEQIGYELWRCEC